MKSILESINESGKKYDNFLNLPPVEELGDGEYDCAVGGTVLFAMVRNIIRKLV